MVCEVGINTVVAEDLLADGELVRFDRSSFAL
jgi:hypothetical protein